jgi:uncharacterized protein YbjQ (UPF0145 family)
MSFNIEAVLGDMLTAVKNSVGSDWGDIEGYAKQVIENEKEMLADLAEQRLRGDLTEDELKSELEDEKDTIKAEMMAIWVMTKATAQRAANAIIDVLFKVIKGRL